MNVFIELYLMTAVSTWLIWIMLISFVYINGETIESDKIDFVVATIFR